LWISQCGLKIVKGGTGNFLNIFLPQMNTDYADYADLFWLCVEDKGFAPSV
jgi:hypothetical protein